MGESWPRSPVQTERSEVCTSDRGQDSPIQTDLARLIRCLLYGQTRKQRNKNINNFICFPARAQAFSWLSSVTGLQSKRDKNNCSKSSFVQTSSMNEDKIFHTGSMKKLVAETTIYEKWLKVQLQCTQCLFVPRLITTENVENVVHPSIGAPAKIAWGWICWTVKTFCCVVLEVLTWFSSDWADVPGSRFRIAVISRCRFRDVEW